MDPGLKLYDLVIYNYGNDSPPWLFLAADLVSGVSMLKSGNTVYWTTGGVVDFCALMPIMEAKYKRIE